MDRTDKENTFLVEQTTTLIFESAASARRKRMEIRRLKKFSSLSVPYPGQQGVFKRSAAPIQQYLQCSGLVRSKSLPQEQMRTGRCVLHITKSGRDQADMKVEGHFMAAVNGKHGSIVREGSAELYPLSDRVPSSVDPGKTMVLEGEVLDIGSKVLPVAALEVSNSILGLNQVKGNAEGLKLDLKSAEFRFSTDQRSNLDVCRFSTDQRSNLDVCMSDPGDNSSVVLEDNSKVIASVVPASTSARSNSQVSQRCPLSGKVLVCGRRREMEDTAVIVPSFMRISLSANPDELCDLHFYAVYDGHGGSQASNFCAGRLHHALAEELARSSVKEGMEDDLKWRAVMASCFLKIDQEVGGVCPSGACGEGAETSVTCCANAIAPENVGTTAVVAVFSPSTIILANCGDSRAVLSRGGAAIPLTKDHKPDKDGETSRIEAAGGRVIQWDGYRVSGLLALSRAIGDRYLKEYVISDPDVLCVPRRDDDECLILASDGLWDVISNETACDVARRCLLTARQRSQQRRSRAGEDTASAAVAALLVKLAYGRGSKDNISVVVIDLKVSVS